MSTPIEQWSPCGWFTIGPNGKRTLTAVSEGHAKVRARIMALSASLKRGALDRSKAQQGRP